MKQTIVFYDGSCRMCVGFTGWLQHIDGKKQFRLEPYQDSELLKNYPHLKAEDLEYEIHIITEKGKVFRGADAMLEIWGKSGHWSSFLAGVFKIPPFIWIARLVYKAAAKYRKGVM